MASVSTNELKNGWTLLLDGNLMQVIEFQHVKPGKGGAFVRTKLKDIQSGKIIDHTFNAGARLEFIRVEAKQMQFLKRTSLRLPANRHIAPV